MNTLESFITTDPFGSEDVCAKFVIDNLTDKFIFHDITSTNREYTFSCWLKSDAEGSVNIGGKTFASSESWKKCVATFKADGVDFIFQFLATGTYYLYHSQLEIGNKATDWKAAPEDTETKITTLTAQYSNIVQDLDGFKTTVGKTYVTKDAFGVEIDAVMSIATQTADKFNWVVQSGTSATDFTLTDRMIEATAEKFVVKSSTGSTIISGGVMNIDQIFAHDITATGTINGVKLVGASIDIGNNFKASPTSITLGGFKIDNDSFFSGTWGSSGTTPPTVFMCTGSTPSYSIAGSGQIAGWAFGAGTTFGVTNDGKLYSTKGKIGGWSIESGRLYYTLADGNEVGLSGTGLQFTDNTNQKSYVVPWKQAIQYLYKNAM